MSRSNVSAMAKVDGRQELTHEPGVISGPLACRQREEYFPLEIF